MCGITGIFDIHGSNEIDRGLLERMNRTQIHRGPNEGTTHIEPGLGLGHRRLSIMDVAGGQQPLFNEDGSVVVVFNGEIYNFQALVAELTALGHQFRTHCDTEVIVHAWEQWGEHCVDRFNGMFAFGLWDRNRQTLFMARDRLGIKPFYYTLLHNGLFLFASELKALLAYPELDKTFDHQAIEDYFAYGYIPEPRTIFNGTFKLKPGYLLKLTRGQTTIQPRQYWDVPFVRQEMQSEQETEEALIAQLRKSVNSQLMSEVPLGAFLSGGVDSSAVVAMMAEEMKASVNTCSIAFSDPAFDESEYAQQVATRYSTRHFTEQVAQDDLELVDQLAALYDEPFADSSAIPTYRVCQLAKKHVTVVLSGDGGDENFAGYRRYRWHMMEEKLRARLPLGLRRPLFGMLGHLYPKADWAPKFLRAKATFETLARDSVEGYFHSVSILGDKLRAQLFSPAFRSSLQGYQAVEVLRDYAANSPTQDKLSLIQYLDIKTYLVGDILTKVDRASMAHSLEVRVPLLDHELVEWVSGLSPSLKLHQQEGKYILKKSLEAYLPQTVLYRNKMGFAVPLASWFRGPLRERVRAGLLSDTLADTGIFNMAFIEKMLDQHQSGRSDFSAPIWTLLMFESFLRNTFGENGELSDGYLRKVA
ncbi:MAG: amidotransferase 1, exosortase A system-associated [Nitrosomonas sp.]|nr:amidotransferase 1, exosortase A system-associated [Nitrosomonas sp.]